MKKLKVIVEKTSTGYSAHADKYPVYTTGKDVQEMIDNLIDAANYYFEDLGEKPIAKQNLDIAYSIPSFFELYPINVRHFAERIGMNYTLLSQYVQGRKKPSEKQTEKIVQGLQEVGRELSGVSLL